MFPVKRRNESPVQTFQRLARQVVGGVFRVPDAPDDPLDRRKLGRQVAQTLGPAHDVLSDALNRSKKAGLSAAD